MAASQLTSATVERLPYEESSAGWCVHWHEKLKGFGLRVFASGARAYVVSYRLRGSRRSKLKTIGKLTTFSFGQAYERAREVLREAERGVDWFEKVKRERGQTMGDVWRYYVSEHLSGPNISERTPKDQASLWKNHCQREFDHRSLADITSEQARDWHRRVTHNKGKKRKYVANRAGEALQAAWNYGQKYGKVPRELANPFESIEWNDELIRKTILEPHQFPRFAAAINAVENPFARAYLWILFYTGARRTELTKLTWSDVELPPARKDEPRLGSILFRKTKGKEPRRVALSAPAVEILEALPRTDNPHVFAGAVENTNVAPEDHWHVARKAAGLPDLRMHDLRRSFGSWLGASGVAPKLIGAVLGHKTDITSRVYVQLGEAANIKRQLATAHAKLAAEFAKDSPQSEVEDITASART